MTDLASTVDWVEHARRAGYVTTDDVAHPIDPDAVRMLDEHAPGLAVGISGDVLHVICPDVPSPAEFAALERASGMSVTVTVTSRQTFAVLCDRALQLLPEHAPRALGPALLAAEAAGATDILLTVGDTPRVRVAGAVKPVGRFPMLSSVDLAGVVTWLTGAVPEPGTGGCEATAKYGESRWRASVMYTSGHLAVVARRIPLRIPRLEELGLPGTAVQLAQAEHGLVVIAGPGGAGKSTTAAALVDRINATRPVHIVTIEDPVEYGHTPMLASVHQREVGADVASFAEGVRAAFRQAPDVLLVGELRDAESVRAALDAAAGGCVVITTVTAATTENALMRILQTLPVGDREHARHLLASTLRAVVTQQLVDSVDNGAQQLVCEVLLGTDAVRRILRDDRLHEASGIAESSAAVGMTSMDASLARYVTAGRIAEGVARAAAPHQDRFAGHLSRAARRQEEKQPVAPQSGSGPRSTRRHRSAR